MPTARDVLNFVFDSANNVLNVNTGTGATDIAKIEDDPHVTGDAGTQMLAVRQDTQATLVDADGDYSPLQVDAEGGLYTRHAVTGVGDGTKVVTTAGTDLVLATSTVCKKVDIQAQTDNTGWIAVGATGVDATVATGTGVLLDAGDVYSLEVDNLADIYIDSTVNGEGVRYTYYT